MRNLTMSEAAQFSQCVPVDMQARMMTTTQRVRRDLAESSLRASIKARMARQSLAKCGALGFGLGLVLAVSAMALGLI